MKKPFFYLRTRIFLSMIILVFISFLLIGISTNFQISESSYYYHELRLDRKESQLQRAISYEFINNIDGSNDSQKFRDQIFKISDKLSIMRNGEKVLSGYTHDFQVNDVIKAMLGTVKSINKISNDDLNKKVILNVENLNSGKVLKNINFQIFEGEILDGEGGYTVRGEGVSAKFSKNNKIVPLGLSDGARVKKNIKKNQLITMDLVEVEYDKNIKLAREYQYNLLD